MSYDHTALEIIADGINQFLMHAPSATDSIARLRGAHGYLAATGHVLRDETMSERKTASVTVGHIIPQLDNPEVE